MRLLKRDKAYSIDELWASGLTWIEQFNSLAPSIVRLDAYPTRGAFVGTPLNVALFMQEAARAGVLFCKSWFYNFNLMRHQKEVLGLCKDILTSIKAGRVQLTGEMPASPFAQQVREKKT